MSLKSAIVIITLITIVSLVGVGFATWTFDSEVEGNVSGISGYATAAIEAENLEVKNSAGTATVSTLYIICDSPDDHGIYWSTTNDSTALANQITQLQLVGTVNVEDHDIVDYSAYKGTFTCTFDEYTTSTYIKIAAVSFEEEATSSGAHSNITCNFTLPALSYLTTPSSMTEVDDLQAEANAIAVTFTFTFAVTGVVAA